MARPTTEDTFGTITVLENIPSCPTQCGLWLRGPCALGVLWRPSSLMDRRKIRKYVALIDVGDARDLCATVPSDTLRVPRIPRLEHSARVSHNDLAHRQGRIREQQLRSLDCLFIMVDGTGSKEAPDRTTYIPIRENPLLAWPSIMGQAFVQERIDTGDDGKSSSNSLLY